MVQNLIANRNSWIKTILILLCLSLLIVSPAMAHHPMGGGTPENFTQGFLSGLAHPVIGLDHFAIVVAIGFLAALKPQGILIPIGFVLAAALGTGLHLMGIELPLLELVIACSVVAFGIFTVNKDYLSSWVLLGLASVFGVFHGYAYGEAIFGAAITPLVSYLAGFTLIQIAIASSAFWVSQKFVGTLHRSVGFIICGIGMSFIFSQAIDLILPSS